MKKYTRPNLEIASFDVEDIITVSGASGAIVNSAELKGQDLSMYEVYKDNSAAPSDNVSVFTW